MAKRKAPVSMRDKVVKNNPLDMMDVESIAKTILDLLDMDLTSEQRHIADQMYDLFNKLEATVE